MKCLCLLVLLGMFLQELSCIDPSEESEEMKSQDHSSHIREGRNVDASDVSKGYCYPGPRFPRDCHEVYELYYFGTDSRTHVIKPDGAPNPFAVFCNNSIDEGGWTVLQRRVNGSVDFYRNWRSYQQGFGKLNHEYWLGNDNIHFLTKQRKYKLRVDMVNSLGAPYHAVFDWFVINGEEDNYRLSSLGSYSGTAYDTRYDQHGYYPGEALLYHLGAPFSTYDRDNDDYDYYNIADLHHGAWWYREYLTSSNLNGDYKAAGHWTSIWWLGLPGDEENIRYTSLMVRPTT